jgi:hypothetical protein
MAPVLLAPQVTLPRPPATLRFGLCLWLRQLRMRPPHRLAKANVHLDQLEPRPRALALIRGSEILVGEGAELRATGMAGLYRRHHRSTPRITPTW